MTYVSPMVAVVLTLLTCGATDASILCTWTKVLSNGEVHYSFLQSDPSPHRLYHSVWSSSRTLLSCSFSANKRIIQTYITLCHEDRQDFSHQRDLHFERMIDEEEQCTSMDSVQLSTLEKNSVKSVKRLARSTGEKGGSGVKTNQRFRRGLIVPGTLWCGSGNKAPSYSDLGVFSETDKCCREHDHCQDTILSFHSKFGVFNRNIFTMSHCDCDNRFHHCLKDAQDSISNVVGFTFFNLLKVHCFKLTHRLQCIERNWFGMCKESKMSLYAVVHAPSLYVTDSADSNDTSLNTTTSTPVHNTQPLLNATTESSPSTHSTQTSLITPTSVTTPVTRITTLLPSKSPNQTLPLLDHPSTHSAHTSLITPTNVTTPVTRITTLLPSKSPNQTLPLLDTNITGKWCAIYKYLDECRNRILPLQRKYGFRNNESRTMYHCNCTDRLFQSLAAYPVLTEAQTFLLNFVSHTCFALQDCKADQSCKAIARTMLSQVQAGGTVYVSEQRPLQVMRLRVRTPTLKRGTNRSPRLHRLCLRIVKRKVHKSRRHHSKEPARKKLE